MADEPLVVATGHVWRSNGTRPGWWAVCLEEVCRGTDACRSDVLPMSEDAVAWLQQHADALHVMECQCG